MKDKYGCKVGYSGHEKSGLAISIAAVALGATSIERHITLDRALWGTDQSASLSEQGIKALTNIILKTPIIMKQFNAKSTTCSVMFGKIGEWKTFS